MVVEENPDRKKKIPLALAGVNIEIKRSEKHLQPLFRKTVTVKAVTIFQNQHF